MGCDIHMVLERRYGDRWIGISLVQGHYAALRRNSGERFNYEWPAAKDRNYGLFAALAGVRGDGPDPRGIPSDVSELARAEIDGWGIDGHSHSWGLLPELLPVFKEHVEGVVTLVTRRLTSNTAPLNDHLFAEMIFEAPINEHDGEGIADYRLIYWFDN